MFLCCYCIECDSCFYVVIATAGHKQGGIQLPCNGRCKVRSWLLEAGKWHHSSGDSYVADTVVIYRVAVTICNHVSTH